MDSPTNFIVGLLPEFNNIISSDCCHLTPSVIDLSDATALSEPIPLTAVTQKSACLQEGIVNHSASIEGHALYSGPKAETRLVKRKEIIELKNWFRTSDLSFRDPSQVD